MDPDARSVTDPTNLSTIGTWHGAARPTLSSTHQDLKQYKMLHAPIFSNV